MIPIARAPLLVARRLCCQAMWPDLNSAPWKSWAPKQRPTDTGQLGTPASRALASSSRSPCMHGGGGDRRRPTWHARATAGVSGSSEQSDRGACCLPCAMCCSCWCGVVWRRAWILAVVSLSRRQPRAARADKTRPRNGTERIRPAVIRSATRAGATNAPPRAPGLLAFACAASVSVSVPSRPAGLCWGHGHVLPVLPVCLCLAGSGQKYLLHVGLVFSSKNFAKFFGFSVTSNL